MDNLNCRPGYIVVTDHIPADGSADVSDAIQRIIDENPNRTIYFPDGLYRISKPILTPAHPEKSVALRLSSYAVIQAADDWSSPEALIRLGAIHFANDIRTNGSNYSLVGGILDGRNVAGGVSIDGGRETMIRDVSIKHATIGLYIKTGANNRSSDADVYNVNIIGSGAPDSVGVLLEGFDNTLSNMRIADVQHGVILRSCGNMLRSLHPLYTCRYEDYENSCGFWDQAGNNWFDYCYSDHFAIGYRTAPGVSSTYHNSFCMWYAPKGASHTVFRADGAFNSIVSNLRVGFHEEFTNNRLLSVEKPGGRGTMEKVCVSHTRLADAAHEPYLTGEILSLADLDPR
ncbi:MAG: hypothetical protein IJ412_12420 [Oscillospiraceae bacterium]|nr:hypothetical protein [Oscillospiraceae bacterium]